MNPQELEELNIKLARLDELESPLKEKFEAAVLEENWEEAARCNNRLHHINNLRATLKLNIK